MKINVSKFSYDSIKYFICVATHGSLLRASYSLEISQSALSQSMKNLEQSLNVKLFNRNTRGIVLTKEGKELYALAKKGDSFFREAIINTIRSNKSNSIKIFKISASQSILNSYVIPVMKEMILEYNNVNFEFAPYAKYQDVVKQLQGQEVDLMLDKTNEQFIMKEIVTRKVAENNYYFVYNPQFFTFDGELTFQDLENIPIIIKERDGKNDNSWMKASIKRLVICRRDESIINLIKNGVGIGLCPKYIAKREGLKIINIKNYVPTKRTVEAFYLESNDIAKTFVDKIINYIS